MQLGLKCDLNELHATEARAAQWQLAGCRFVLEVLLRITARLTHRPLE